MKYSSTKLLNRFVPIVYKFNIKDIQNTVVPTKSDSDVCLFTIVK